MSVCSCKPDMTMNILQHCLSQLVFLHNLHLYSYKPRQDDIQCGHQIIKFWLAVAPPHV